jgi:DNA-binding NtrC family response regulator
MSPCRNVLLLTEGKDVASLLKALPEHANVTEVSSLSHLASLLSLGDYDVLFCGSEIPGGTWHDALGEVQQRACEIPVVVVARLGGEKQWVEVLGQGAFDMIAAPYQLQGILYLLEHAAASKQARASQMPLRKPVSQESTTPAAAT